MDIGNVVYEGLKFGKTGQIFPMGMINQSVQLHMAEVNQDDQELPGTSLSWLLDPISHQQDPMVQSAPFPVPTPQSSFC